MRFRQLTLISASLLASWFFTQSPAVAQTSSTWTTCAQEDRQCSFTGTRTVRYGARSSWVVRQVTASGGGVRCSNSVFGDPIPGTRKTCQLENAPPPPASWTFCANEGSRCNFSGTRRVRYGANSTWVTRDVTASNGGVSCSNSVFGDPIFGVAKRCELGETSGGSTQQPPTISGTPASSVTVGDTYRFQPNASDPNGDTLAYTISNRPSWASFSTTTGVLTGRPTLGNVGTYSNITISVSDGRTTVRLPSFSIRVVQNTSGTATLSWTPPTQNADGSSLTNLAGYRIYYGTSANSLTQQIEVANPGISTYVVSGLTRGTYYFAVRAYNTAGAESTSSNVASKAIP